MTQQTKLVGAKNINGMGRIFEELECWKASRLLAKTIYGLSNQGKLKYDLTIKLQLKNAAASIVDNVSEGFARLHDRETIRFLKRSQRSATEVKNILYVLEDRAYFETTTLNKIHVQVDETRQLITDLHRTID